MKQIRLATTDDKEEIFQLYRSLVGTPGCTWNEDYPNMEDVEKDLAQQTLYVMCLTKEPAALTTEHVAKETILAAAAANTDDELDMLSCWSKEIHHPCDLARIGVRKEFQNQGLAKELIRHIEQDVLKKGFDGIHFIVSKTNPAALAAYQKLDYHACGETVLFGVEWWCYEKKLSPSQIG